jgi:hypothetical protein
VSTGFSFIKQAVYNSGRFGFSPLWLFFPVLALVVGNVLVVSVFVFADQL